MKMKAEGKITIRKAKLSDFEELYELGSRTPELGVSASEPFMERDVGRAGEKLREGKSQ